MYGATHILATDLDGTLVGDPEALQQLWTFYKEQTYEVALVYVTGRHFRSALSLIAAEELPVPDVLVTDVGTEIRTAPAFEEDRQWKQKMQQDWMPKDISRIAERIPDLVPQQLPVNCRQSYTVNSDRPVELFEQELRQASIPHKLIFSSGRDVDVLPAGSGKGQALRYAIRKFGVQDARILIAGDSGNDLDMLTLGYPAVMVGNAQEELLAAERHPCLFRASRRCAGGIHEAWVHFHS
ncbi:HAD-IIB family hydrolase [Planococcus lenghuensis]|uniref:Hydrolase n=1 Tax=Planococcus lenghuensis TaxID=2213202 RepID=A0A1Q2KV71_9BACL|nr:HAD-IIB family hydrolase [Planococcus lenghuensis]AQQ52118.1 hydrolase [Planococcus lenghuensis]